jgi:arylsulfatase A-like enzyme
MALLAAGPWLYARLGRRRIALALIVTLSAASLAAALWVRQRRLFTMIGIWGESQISGLVIDSLVDLEELRGQLDLQEVRPPARPGAAPRDIVLVTIDTVRADRTGPYGGSVRMPALTRLAGQGAVFQWAFSPGNVTRRSLPSMMLGVSPPRVRGRVAGWALRLDPRHVLAAERLRAAGYDTAGFFCCTSQFGAEHQLGLTRGIAHVVIERSAERLATLASGWLAARADRSRRPVFVWLHFIEPHEWQAYPAGPAGRRRLGAYDAALADVDRALGLVLDAAWAPARRERTFVLVSSDHGEALGDHGHRTHSTSLYNAEIRVPLVISGPGIQPRRIARPVGLTDLAPTILDLAGFVPPGMPAMDGLSLGPLLRGEPVTGEGEAYSAMIPDRSVGTSERALVIGKHKIIGRNDSGQVEIYDLAADPGERRNLAGRLPDVEPHLAARLAARRAVDQVSPF